MSIGIKTGTVACISSAEKSSLCEGITQYNIIERTRNTEEGEVLEYGILQFVVLNGEVSKLAQINGISSELEVVEELVARLYENDVEPCSLFEIIEDFITEKAMIYEMKQG